MPSRMSKNQNLNDANNMSGDGGIVLCFMLIYFAPICAPITDGGIVLKSNFVDQTANTGARDEPA